MENEILEFIHRRFKDNCQWLNGNCYYFALILKERFSCYNPELYYDVVEGHFMCMIENKFYDWSGLITYSDEYSYKYLKNWCIYKLEDPLHYSRIVRDVII